MEWEFTAQEVVRGEVGYGLGEFRRDLCEEIRTNVPGMDDDGLDSLFRLVYDLHYWLATGNAYREFEREFRDQPNLVMLLRAVQGGSAGNVEMLGAILQRTIMDGVEAGANLEQALERAGEEHRKVSTLSPFAHDRGSFVPGCS
jgi:hypothetical protein